MLTKEQVEKILTHPTTAMRELGLIPSSALEELGKTALELYTKIEKTKGELA